MIKSVPKAVLREVETIVSSTPSSFSFCSGGCINQGGQLRTGSGSFFVKWNYSNSSPGMFKLEAEALSLLKSTGSIAVPDVIFSGSAGDYQFLLLEFIHEGERQNDYWRRFGSALAGLHQCTAKTYGLDHDNYIGSLRQSNRQLSSWVEFFIAERLQKQLQSAVDGKKLDPDIARPFGKLFGKLSSLLVEEQPALVHGDLWGGNLMTTADGQPCLIDPAVFFGHREVDLAMTHLFGGFDLSYIEEYERVYPLLPGFRERVDLYNLYPLLVHVNLFGGEYARQVKNVLSRFV